MKRLHDFDTMCFAVKGRNNGHQVYEKMELHMQVGPLFPIHIQIIQAICFAKTHKPPKKPATKKQGYIRPKFNETVVRVVMPISNII